MKTRYACVLVMAALVFSCGRAERKEAVGLFQVLKQQQAGFTSANNMEQDLYKSARAWADGIAVNGSGAGADLSGNAAVARDLAKSADMISAQVGLVRQAIYNHEVREEYPQSIRTGLIGQLTKRQRRLQDLRAQLDETAKGLVELGQAAGYKGDSYPGTFPQLRQMVDSYKTDDAVPAAMSALKAKYDIKDADLAS